MTGQAPSRAAVLAALAVPEVRAEGPAIVTGAARYAADRALPGMLHARFLASPLAHARVRRIDARRARTMPGVHAVLTGEDLRGIYYGCQLMDRPVLAWDRVRFIGDRLAAVAAETVEQAEAALSAIGLDLEPLETILAPEDALVPGAPLLHPDAADYVFVGPERPPVSHPNLQGELLLERGARGADLEAIFAAAPHVFSHTYRTPRQHHGAIEPHATLVWIDAADVLHVVTTSKRPFLHQRELAKTIGLPLEKVEVEASFVGGDFGGKAYSIDEFACAFLARATGRPIQAVARYAEELGELTVRHAATMRLRTAVDADGRILAHEADVVLDGGAYAAPKPTPKLVPPGAVATMRPYEIPNVRIRAAAVYTNTVPGGAVRAPGEVQANFAGECHVDEIARALGIDPLEFRLRNAVRQGGVGASGERYREARAAEVLEAVRDAMAWDRPLATGHGRGVALGARAVGGGALTLRLLLHADGRIEVFTGLAEHGGGVWTQIRRVFAATLSVPESRVEVIHVPTSGAAFDAGLGGSRVAHISSRAGERLALRLREWLDERLPGVLPGASPEVTLIDDAFVDEHAAVLASFDAVAERLVPTDAPLELSATYDSVKESPAGDDDYDFGACAVEVVVDRETGAVEITDALLAVDIGMVINPVAHRGQLEGGFIFGLGEAAMEELTVEDGKLGPLSLADFKLPVQGDVPPLRIIELPTAVGPGAQGAKMAGELTNTKVSAALANAIADATGARVRELPLLAERIRAAIDAIETAGTDGA